MQYTNPNPAPRKPRRRWRWVLVLLVLAAAFGYWKMHHAAKPETPKGKPQAPIVVAPAVRKDIPVYLNGLGTIQASNTVTVHSQVDGQLMEVKFQEGQDVKAGDVIARIDPRTFQAQYDQAVATKAKDMAQLANAQLDLKRYAALGKTISGQTRDTQAATVKQLEATVQADQGAIDAARTQLGYTTVTAPINGRTGIRQVDQGNIVHPSDTNGLVVITQLKPISVIFSLPQQNIAAVNAAMGGTQGKLPALAVNADNSVIEQGKLVLMDNEIDATTGTVRLKANFPNAKYTLWPGGFVNVRLLLDTRKAALVVPSVAIQRNQQNAPYVFVYQPEEGTVKMQLVTIDMTEGLDTVVLEGLNEGAQIVTDGMAKLRDGMKVSLNKPENAAPDAAAKPPADAAPDAEQKPHHSHKKEG